MQQAVPSIQMSGWDYAIQYGVLGVLALVFALVIRHLYSKREEDNKAAAKEREQLREGMLKREAEHAIQIAKIQADADRQVRDAAEKYAEMLRADVKESRAREDLHLAREDRIRGEFSDLMETIASKAAEASDATKQVLDKIYERFIGPRKPGY